MDWNARPSDDVIEATAKAMRERQFQVIIVDSKGEALNKLKTFIPAKASVMTGSSTTLDQIGFNDFLKSSGHPWNNLKGMIIAEKDPAKQYDLRRQSILGDYYLGSLQAIAQTGELVLCDATGTRTGPYAFGPKNVVIVTGYNKLTGSLDLALKRMWEHCVPLEDKRVKSTGGKGTTVNRIFIFRQENRPPRTTVILIKEILGF